MWSISGSFASPVSARYSKLRREGITLVCGGGGIPSIMRTWVANCNNKAKKEKKVIRKAELVTRSAAGRELDWSPYSVDRRS